MQLLLTEGSSAIMVSWGVSSKREDGWVCFGKEEAMGRDE